jgi:phage terminase small subunit
MANRPETGVNCPRIEKKEAKMAGKGRSPYATFDTLPYGTPSQRIRPPDYLGDLEKRVFRDLVSQCPADQFRKADTGLLARWAELSVMAEQAACEMTIHGRVTPDGRVSPWVSIYTQAIKGLSGLALRLRISPQARMSKAPKVLPRELSFYDEMELTEAEGGDDDGDGADGGRH